MGIATRPQLAQALAQVSEKAFDQFKDVLDMGIGIVPLGFAEIKIIADEVGYDELMAVMNDWQAYLTMLTFYTQIDEHYQEVKAVRREEAEEAVGLILDLNGDGDDS